MLHILKYYFYQNWEWFYGVEVRHAKLTDYKNISNISKELHLYHLKNRSDIYKEARKTIYRTYFNELLKDNEIEILVVTLDDKIVGYSIVRYIEINNMELLKDKYFAYIDEICIKEGFRRMGFGKILFNKIYEMVKSNGAESLELGVWGFNESAIEFYKSMGMVEKTIRMEKN